MNGSYENNTFIVEAVLVQDRHIGALVLAAEHISDMHTYGRTRTPYT